MQQPTVQVKQEVGHGEAATFSIASTTRHSAAYFVEQNGADVMSALGVAKPVPPPLEIINVEDASTAWVARMTSTVATLLEESIIYQGTSWTAPTAAGRSKRPFINNTSRTRKKVRIQPPATNSTSKGADNANTTSDAAKCTTLEDSPPAPTERVVKTEEHLLDVNPADSAYFDGPTKVSYILLQEKLVKYMSYYTSPFN